MTSSKKYFVTALLVLSAAAPLPAQRFDPSAGFILNLDFSRFRYDDSTGYVELYHAFYPTLVTLDGTPDGSYRGWIRMTVRIRTKAEGVPVVHEVNILPVVVRDSASLRSSMTMVSASSYRIPAGEYFLDVLAVDSLSPNRRDSLLLPLSVPAMGSRTMVSDLELCSRITEGASEGMFVKNTLEVVPNPSLAFGSAGAPIVFHYAELYDLKAGVRYFVETSIIDNRNTVVRRTGRWRTYSVPHAVDIGTTNVAAVPSGRYVFSLRLLKDSTEEVARSTKIFFVSNPHLQAVSATETSSAATELAGLTFEELGTEFATARYLASSKEVEMFSKLTTADARREFLGTFWTEVGKGHEGHEPTTRVEYQMRVTSANQKFRVHNREGWRSDRGRVYILYGDPDEIERVPSEGDSKPSEVWHYYQIENGVLFIFADRSGFGEYVLVHSTKRGELQDESWQRMLR